MYLHSIQFEQVDEDGAKTDEYLEVETRSPGVGEAYLELLRETGYYPDVDPIVTSTSTGEDESSSERYALYYEDGYFPVEGHPRYSMTIVSDVELLDDDADEY